MSRTKKSENQKLGGWRGWRNTWNVWVISYCSINFLCKLSADEPYVKLMSLAKRNKSDFIFYGKVKPKFCLYSNRLCQIIFPQKKLFLPTFFHISYWKCWNFEILKFDMWIILRLFETCHALRFKTIVQQTTKYSLKLISLCYRSFMTSWKCLKNLYCC